MRTLNHLLFRGAIISAAFTSAGSLQICTSIDFVHAKPNYVFSASIFPWNRSKQAV